MTHFQLALDPIMLLSDRAALCLFLRGDFGAAPADVTNDLKAAVATLRAAVVCEPTNGSYAVVTPRTCGLFAERGERRAGALAAEVSGASAAVRASVLDSSDSLRTAGRILVVHLTDAASEGAVFSGERLNTQEREGGNRLLARSGRATIRLARDAPEDCDVWALATDGARRAKVSARAVGGELVFAADVARDRTNATFLYEVIRNRARKERIGGW